MHACIRIISSPWLGYTATTPPPTALPTALPRALATSLPTPRPTEPVIKLSTPDRKGAKADDAKGIAFTVLAKRAVVVTGMAVVARADSEGDVRIYTRVGRADRPKFDDASLKSARGWLLVHAGKLPNQSDRLYALDDFVIPVRMAAGQVQSFYVFSRKGLEYTSNGSEGDAYGEDDSVAVRVGRTTRGLFRRPSGTGGKFAGVVRYRLQ